MQPGACTSTGDVAAAIAGLESQLAIALDAAAVLDDAAAAGAVVVAVAGCARRLDRLEQALTAA